MGEITALETAVLRGQANAVADARKAAASGDTRLYDAQSFGWENPPGISCDRPSGRSDAHYRGGMYYSDVPGDCSHGTLNASCDARDKLGGYMAAYNAAMIQQPNFPDADLCRVGIKMGSQDRIDPTLSEPQEFVGYASGLTSTPRTLHEAARRGTLDSLAEGIRRAGGVLNTKDDSGLTPLAWAVIRNRPDAAEMLLRHGADPFGSDCDLKSLKSPVRLALAYGRPRLIELLVTPGVARRAWPWPTELIEAAVQGRQATVVTRMLSEPHEAVVATNLAGVARRAGDAATMQAVLGGSRP